MRRSLKVTSMQNDDAGSLRAPTVKEDGGRRWIYPDRRKGRLSNIRKYLAIFLMAIYLIVPFSTLGGLPLIRLDVLSSQAYFFTLVFPFHDTSYLVFLLILAMLLLFLGTALFGRVWCGYGCPQTVFVEWLIRPIEELIEGNARKRQIRDKGPWNGDKTWRKLVKYFCFGIIVLIISNAFLAYFVDPRLVLSWMMQSPAEQPTAFAVVMSVAGLLFFDLVWFREQFCSFLCPYARFQSVMIDRDTPTIAYDFKRGEPRGRSKQGSGDCINCNHCVRVCPTGIDIRNGLQLECIQCGRCADACDQIMTNLKRPKGLIRTATANHIESPGEGKLRIRPLFYLLALAVTIAIGGSRIYLRSDIKYNIVRTQGTSYTRLPDGRLSNFFSVRINNQTARNLKAGVAAGDHIEIVCGICSEDLKPHQELSGNMIVIFPETLSRHSINVKLNHSDDAKLPLILPDIAQN